MKQMAGVQEGVDAAVRAGWGAFWQAVRAQYAGALGATVGPVMVDPEVADVLSDAMRHAVRAWVQSNVGLDLFETWQAGGQGPHGGTV